MYRRWRSGCRGRRDGLTNQVFGRHEVIVVIVAGMK
jgi:hypothetical protein